MAIYTNIPNVLTHTPVNGDVDAPDHMCSFSIDYSETLNVF